MYTLSLNPTSTSTWTCGESRTPSLGPIARSYCNVAEWLHNYSTHSESATVRPHLFGFPVTCSSRHCETTLWLWGEWHGSHAACRLKHTCFCRSKEGVNARLSTRPNHWLRLTKAYATLRHMKPAKWITPGPMPNQMLDITYMKPAGGPSG